MEKPLEALRRRARQLAEKRPGYGELLAFYVNVRQAQMASRASVRIDPAALEKRLRDRPAQADVALLGKADFPVDVAASRELFHALCRIGRTANPHLALQAEKADAYFKAHPDELKPCLTGATDAQASAQAAADPGLAPQVLAFLIRNSTRPSLEASSAKLSTAIDLETWRQCHCPVCGGPPGLNLLRGEGGKRYSLCSNCGCQWRIDRLSCAICGNREQGQLNYFHAEGEAACRIDLCDRCHHYVKTIDERILETCDPELEDLATPHLDLLAAERGFTRAAPNPWTGGR
ncbi:MAG: formate dehydrogenase accessory protein FdhE [Desulfobacterales bacterium]|nr:formate dehydrogenase accessory protein FdhE [Desulfobacterales bacterium]